ncbi:MAG TPA: GNAT family N-acetyltransferase [Rhodothermales bacterium]
MSAPPGPIIRPCTESDVSAVASILNESIAARDSTLMLEPVSDATVLGWMAHFNDRERLFVLEEAGVVVGWGIIRRYSDREGYRLTCETSIFLRRSERGRGLGSFLQRALMDRCRELGYHHLVAKIFADNQTSIRLHQRFGYRMVGVQKEIGIVDGRWQDVAILQYVFDENDSPTNQ